MLMLNEWFETGDDRFDLIFEHRLDHFQSDIGRRRIMLHSCQFRMSRMVVRVLVVVVLVIVRLWICSPFVRSSRSALNTSGEP